MRIALIADIHANLPALEAVLRAIGKHAPDCIISLGDQVNLGPCPKETLALLREHDVLCLQGNHERYILGSMEGDPQYDGANWHSLRFNARLLSKEDMSLPLEHRIEHVTLCHAMPGDDRFPVNEPNKALPRLKAMRPAEPVHIICGHGHNPTHYRLPNLTLDGIGSAGCMDDGAPGTTAFTMLNLESGCATLQPYTVPYDTRALYGLFKRSGMADFCPIMARIICLQMEQNRDYLVDFVKKALAISDTRGEETVSLETWQLADSLFDWPDGQTTAAFWHK